MYLAFLVFASYAFASAEQNNTAPTVATGDGTVQGFASQNGIEKFFGIPFARPPVGELRFAAPLPSLNWSGTLDASNLRNSCSQLSTTGFKMFNTPLSEDCLYLNVYRPREPRAENLVVMVWFHGGGYTTGTANAYDPTPLVKAGNVIVVTVNYRLAAFGFIYHDGEVSSNGIRDQQLALKWVKTNIAAFGGNPGQVTIFGESAGSGSVAHHIMSPTSRGLFQRAILQSGTLGASWATVSIEKANATALRLAGQLGCLEQGLIDWSCLRDQTTENITKNMAGFFGPTPDGEVVTTDPFTMSDPLTSDDVDTLIGFASSEGFMLFFFTEPKLAEVTRNFTDLSYLDDSSNFANFLYTAIGSENGLTGNYVMTNRSLLHLALTYEYLRSAHTPVERLKALDAANSDVHFRHGGVNFANKLADEGKGNVFFYEFDHKFDVDLFGPPQHLYHGVGHGTDLAAMFGVEAEGGGSTDGLFGLEVPSQLSFDPVRGRIVKYWTDFAKAGNPGGPFQAYSSDRRNYVHIGSDGDEEREGYLGSYYKFWENYVPRLSEFGAILFPSVDWIFSFTYQVSPLFMSCAVSVMIICNFSYLDMSAAS